MLASEPGLLGSQGAINAIQAEKPTFEAIKMNRYRILAAESVAVFGGPNNKPPKKKQGLDIWNPSVFSISSQGVNKGRKRPETSMLLQDKPDALNPKVQERINE